jgi:hypothetical protein
MNRNEFEQLRDLPGKYIEGDITLVPRKKDSPLWAAKAHIGGASIEVRLDIEWNAKNESKTLNVTIPGIGAICRLEIDSKPHYPYGRNHKHALKESDCPTPSINLSRDIQNRDDLSGKDMQEIFNDFCRKAKIEHRGQLVLPKI